jgi:organic radical activating enzyme
MKDMNLIPVNAIINWEEGKHSCNNSCPYCTFKGKSLPAYFPDFQLIKNLKKNNKIQKLIISGGGDPLYNIDNPVYLQKLSSLLEYCKKLNIPTTIITKEYFSITEFLNSVKVLPDQISISVDSFDESLWRLFISIKFFYNVDIRLSYVIHNTNDETLSIIQDLKKYNLPLFLKEDTRQKNLVNNKEYIEKIKKISNIIIPYKGCLNSIYILNNEIKSGYEFLDIDKDTEDSLNFNNLIQEMIF